MDRSSGWTRGSFTFRHGLRPISVGHFRVRTERPENAVRPPHRPRGQTCGKVIDQRLNVGRTDRVDSTIAKRRKDMGPEVILISGPACRRALPGWKPATQRPLSHRYAATAWIEHHPAEPVSLGRGGIGVRLLLARKRARDHTATDPGADVVTGTRIRQLPLEGQRSLTPWSVLRKLGGTTVTILPLTR